jgi:hypothetical protein
MTVMFPTFGINKPLRALWRRALAMAQETQRANCGKRAVRSL